LDALVGQVLEEKHHLRRRVERFMTSKSRKPKRLLAAEEAYKKYYNTTTDAFESKMLKYEGEQQERQQ
jgi:hypothetical protein